MNWPNTIASASLLVAFAALCVSIRSCQTGAVELKQDTSITKLEQIVRELSDGYDSQLTTNNVLRNSLTEQRSEIAATIKLDSDVYKQLLISKKSLSLLLEDKAYNSKLDSQALYFQTRRLHTIFFFDMLMFLRHPLDTAQNIGPLFEQKLNSLEGVVTALVANRLIMPRRYEYPNLMSLLKFIDQTHVLFTNYSYNYRRVDSAIVSGFLNIGLGLQYIEKDEPASDKAFKDALQRAGTNIGSDADKVYKQVTQNK